MNEREERIARLLERGALERAALARAADDLRAELEAARARWRRVSVLAKGAAFAGTLAYRLASYRKTSAKWGNIADTVAGGLVLLKLFSRLRKLW
jgi:hypothetical protein